ncbi:phosphonate C-P lyase system protein PhnG [Polaromonas sp.]|jgi:alpha-D-ribose 1-methylphosphonate 5-triphosphate synthase subunit PhnG|uniref:phosphonate C-P lyase system protein PhnG n=1 Tax=Polaromonas sp. TaxID=1869339 RepID=UPI002C7E72C8|nr:phosphonate C-P lyase system protein PhnG [Polaromonas sp.]HQS89584.1 phosphonate C-P lyase system protein PhnG [Polaromonas sp.]
MLTGLTWGLNNTEPCTPDGFSTLVTDLDIYMTAEISLPPNPARQAWLAVLARASMTQLESALPEAATLLPLQRVRPAEVGMVMLRARVGGTGNAFNLGEASVARCAVRLGDGPLGVGYVLGRDKRRAEVVAIFDALLQDPAHHDTLRTTLIDGLTRVQAQARQSQQQRVADSKVEFFTFVRGEA